MIDFIVITASVETLFNNPKSFSPFEWKGLWFFPKFKKGILKGFESEYSGLQVVLTNDEIKISNSLHKFYKGNNYSDFTYSELRKAIEKICQKFGIKAEHWKIKKMEFGFIIITPRPANDYLNYFLEYMQNEFEKMKKNKHYYGRKCYLTEYALKVYDKGFQTKLQDKLIIPTNSLRVELCYIQSRKLPNQIKTLSDLLDKEKFKALYKDFYEAFSKVIYNDEVDFTNSTDEERVLFFASLNSNFIKEEEKIDKIQAKAKKLKIKQVKERFFKKEFKQWFLKSLSDKYIELYCN